MIAAALQLPGTARMVMQFRSARPTLKILYVIGVIDRLLDHRPLLWRQRSVSHDLTLPCSALILMQNWLADLAPAR
jgi:hypothetical protein